MPNWVERAARNNAEWCQAMYRAHGRAGCFLPDLWYNPGTALPFYPSVVTLTGSPGAGAQVARIVALISAGQPGAWAVKDSFLALDLHAMGFCELFRAEWIHAAPQAIGGGPDIPGVSWARVTHSEALVRWERACRGGEDHPPLFPAGLLDDPEHAVIAGRRDGEIVAGCIASRSADVVGMSNIFLPVEDRLLYRHACITAVAGLHRGWPLVGYESGQDLADMQALGFHAIGPLRVWLREAGKTISVQGQSSRSR
jgi:hypothetical protein